MKAATWRNRIRESCSAVGTLRDAFVPAINALAEILEQRDNVYQDYLASGAEPVIWKLSDRGSEQLVPNPRLKLWTDLNNQALAYWRDLGLTPAGLKKIDEQAMKPKKKSALAEALRDLGS